MKPKDFSPVSYPPPLSGPCMLLAPPRAPGRLQGAKRAAQSAAALVQGESEAALSLGLGLGLGAVCSEVVTPRARGGSPGTCLRNPPELCHEERALGVRVSPPWKWMSDSLENCRAGGAL